MASHVFVDGVRFVPATISKSAPAGDDRARKLAALDVRFDSDAGDNLTVRQYLCRLVEEVWREDEGFSGKRPFGNSGWKPDVYGALIGAGFIAGKIEDGYPEKYDRAAAEKYVLDLIGLMSENAQPSPASAVAAPPYMSRVLAEKVELDERIAKLAAFFQTPTFAGVNQDEQRRMQAQHAAMSDYSKILGERISAFTTKA